MRVPPNGYWVCIIVGSDRIDELLQFREEADGEVLEFFHAGRERAELDVAQPYDAERMVDLRSPAILAYKRVLYMDRRHEGNAALVHKHCTLLQVHVVRLIDHIGREAVLCIPMKESPSYMRQLLWTYILLALCRL